MTKWQQDVLGEGFESATLPLIEDSEGDVAATLVRLLPETRGVFQHLFSSSQPLSDVDVLYVHGWSDYFFQRDLARYWTNQGARFFALDLRKYGRSMREGQTPGYIEHLSDYDEEIDAALAIMGESEPGRRLVLFGHSTGGLVLSLWAHRHPGRAAAVILNSPWLELQLSGTLRRALAPVVSLRALLNPHEIALPQLDLGFYHRAQLEVAEPGEVEDINPAWRPQRSDPVLSGWLRAVIEGHQRVSDGLGITAPVCVLLSQRSLFGLTWKDEMMGSDTVLEVEGIAKAALRLGSSVTVERIDGALHDVFISRLPARREAYRRLDNWVTGWNAISQRND